MHGANGIDALLPERNDDCHLARTLKQAGLAGATPTLLTAPDEVLRKAQERYLASYHREFFVGLFSEGNFGSPSKRGCQNENLMEPLSMAALERVFAPTLEARFPLRVMFAPENVANLEKTMKSILGKYPSVRLVIGHSDATVATALDALEYGAEGFVHFGNAMGGSIAQRDPLNPEQLRQLAGGLDYELRLKDLPAKYNRAQLAEQVGKDTTYFEIVTDGIHVHPEWFLYVLKQYGADRIVPVTDQMTGTGKEVGFKFSVSDKVAVVSRPSAKNPYHGVSGQDMLLAVLEGTDTIAGSLATDIQLYRNIVYWLSDSYAKRAEIGLEQMGGVDVLSTAIVLAGNSARIHGFKTALTTLNF
jgi:N-acetylglucosamine-6-phosphate deacetylase